ncbi:uncharacterized protein LOC111087681 isoform X2 [Limulus polyphemus]|uniref:Uncharacterized protein LOC111087681 isoform X2 n=1 Tax=Limulus polyphemus TaxID=6850 RepID=A0ABM1T4R1_LIMPO|nr:uncharacterized protein LOC111087681 isoform X2 [Limulus polyphemus]
MVFELCFNHKGTTCQFPAHWTGSWFLKGFRDPVYIKNGALSSRGVCRKVEGEKFLIESKSESCFRCVVIHERHENVLQFKETYCSSNSDLEQKCREISGDAPLYSMFRLNTTPIACPFKDSFTFSYSRGYGECSNPISTVDSCNNDSQLFFKFQACVDVRNSESREEKLTCYGTWKEGSTRYLVAKLEHKDTITEEDKFRCFVYEKLKNESGYQVAQSGDATCDGLFSATEGSRTMTLIRSERDSGAKCRFPHWFMDFSHWQSLDGSKLFTTDHKLKSFYLSNSSREGDSIRLACNRISKLQDSLYEMTVQVTSGCMFGNRGYRCMRIHQRTEHVIEVQIGKQVLHASGACSENVFNSANERYVTLTTKDPRKVGCPVMGEYTMIESKPQFAELVAGGLDDRACVERSVLSAACDEHDQLEFRTQCPSKNKVKSFQCQGSWEENGTHFLIASVLETRRRYCMAFTENDHVLYVSSSPQTCVRTVNLDSLGQGVFSVTNKGGCRDTGGAQDIKQLLSHVLISLVVAHVLNLILSDDGNPYR